MNEELVKLLMSVFLKYPIDELNIADWAMQGDELKVKIEDPADGLVEVYTLALQANGYALSKETGNFKTVNVEMALATTEEDLDDEGDPIC